MSSTIACPSMKNQVRASIIRPLDRLHLTRLSHLLDWSVLDHLFLIRGLHLLGAQIRFGHRSFLGNHSPGLWLRFDVVFTQLLEPGSATLSADSTCAFMRLVSLSFFAALFAGVRSREFVWRRVSSLLMRKPRPVPVATHSQVSAVRNVGFKRLVLSAGG